MKFCKIRNVKSPVRGTGKAAGIDFFVPNFGGNKGFIVNPGTDVLIPSGIKMFLKAICLWLPTSLE